MSADSHTGRNSNNAGSDTAKHYAKGGAMEQFQRSSVAPAAPNMSDPYVQSRTVKATTEGSIKNCA
ncbi:hypothetical protein [Paraburkholderia caffeinilytica]|uniref:hypothetical protein n=1 Tax=Paraburkholderia caffeinilytica TaxID=1761016 RepID=UPI003DA10C67